MTDAPFDDLGQGPSCNPRMSELDWARILIGRPFQPIVADRPRLSHSISLVLGIALLIGLGSPVAAQAPEADVRRRDDAPDEVNVRTSLNDFLVSAEGGRLKSVYIHFVPLQTALFFPTPWPPKDVLATTTVNGENGDLPRNYTNDTDDVLSQVGLESIDALTALTLEQAAQILGRSMTQLKDAFGADAVRDLRAEYGVEGFADLADRTLADLLAATSLGAEDLLDRAFRPQFPFELILDGESTADLAHEVNVDRGRDATTVTMTGETNDIRITKAFRFTNNPTYHFRTELTLENTGEAPVQMADGLRLTLGPGVGQDPDFNAQTRFLVDGEIQDDVGETDRIQGLGFKGQALTFFVRGLNAAEGWRARTANGALQAQLAPLTLEPGERYAVNLDAVGGRSKHLLLRQLGLGDLAPPGFLSQFVIYVGQMLNWFFSWTGNYGWAIILFTLVTRIALFPLMRKQFHNMSKMQEFSPKLQQLREKYPNYKKLKELHPNWSEEALRKRDRENRQSMQQKQMELMREEGVNPLSGCLPMLVQLPILILLYRAIIENAEAIHLSPGFLWMPDLAMQDPTWIIMILTVGTLVLQTRTNPMQSSSPQSAGQQNAMMVFMGGFMLVMLHNFPAGLWMYYFLTNVVQVSQQVFVKWEINQEKAKKAAAEAAQTTEARDAKDATGTADAEAAALDAERLDQTPEMPEANNPDGDDEDERSS